MKKLNPKITIFDPPTQDQLVKRIIRAARNCYQSEELSTPETDTDLISRLIKLNHSSIFEQAVIQFKVDLPNGIHIEWLRHRTGQSHAVESSRYNNYSKGKFQSEIRCIEPLFVKQSAELEAVWNEACQDMERHYMKLLELGATTQEAAMVLNKSLKTSDIITANITGLRTFFLQRCARAAHPEIRRCALALLSWCTEAYPLFFEDLYDKFSAEFVYFARKGWKLAEVEVNS